MDKYTTHMHFTQFLTKNMVLVNSSTSCACLLDIPTADADNTGRPWYDNCSSKEVGKLKHVRYKIRLKTRKL